MCLLRVHVACVSVVSGLLSKKRVSIRHFTNVRTQVYTTTITKRLLLTMSMPLHFRIAGAWFTPTIIRACGNVVLQLNPFLLLSSAKGTNLLDTLAATYAAHGRHRTPTTIIKLGKIIIM